MRRAFFAALVLGLSWANTSQTQAQEWSDYLHWPTTPPYAPANGYEYSQLYDGFYVYPYDRRFFPQISGPGYYNFYSGTKIHGHRTEPMWETGHNYRTLQHYLPGPINCGGNGQRFYFGNHYKLDVF